MVTELFYAGLGDKTAARDTAIAAGLPVIPGSDNTVSSLLLQYVSYRLIEIRAYYKRRNFNHFKTLHDCYPILGIP